SNQQAAPIRGKNGTPRSLFSRRNGTHLLSLQRRRFRKGQLCTGQPAAGDAGSKELHEKKAFIINI
ncbi:hypothetical protein, partial [Akkermansia sp.]|uniref:hypothetical protein n=1 Tax=Akkermansia sp. TaxID=1872421 RepID=UPI003994633D